MEEFVIWEKALRNSDEPISSHFNHYSLNWNVEFEVVRIFFLGNLKKKLQKAILQSSSEEWMLKAQVQIVWDGDREELARKTEIHAQMCSYVFVDKIEIWCAMVTDYRQLKRFKWMTFWKATVNWNAHPLLPKWIYLAGCMPNG